MSALLNLYHRAPYPLRVLAASARGYALRRWRYGEDSERIVAETLARDTWTFAEWHAWLDNRLPEFLERAARLVPFYRARWEARRRNGDRSPAGDLASWDVLSKDDLRANPRAFLLDGLSPEKLFADHTSGTTGKPLNIWWQRADLQNWYAIFDARVRRWNDLTGEDRWAILGGQLVTPFEQQRPPFWVWNAAGRQLYLSAYHLKPHTAADYLDALDRHHITYLLGYPSAMHALANFALEARLPAPRLKVAISNAEPLLPGQRETISQAFDCRVVDTYGMSEVVSAASECEAGTLHLWPDVGVTEVLADDADIPVEAGVTGRLVCTGLLNQAMPLIRYAVGDRGALGEATGPCACGRRLPALAGIEGRMDDVILTRDGRRIGRLDPVFKADLPLLEAQIIQHSLDELEVRVVTAPGFTEDSRRELVQRVRQRVGDMSVRITPVNAIPRTANGKFRAVISRINPTTSQTPSQP